MRIVSIPISTTGSTEFSYPIRSINFKMIYAVVQIVADGNAGNRTGALAVRDSADALKMVTKESGTIATAGQTRKIIWHDSVMAAYTPVSLYDGAVTTWVASVISQLAASRGDKICYKTYLGAGAGDAVTGYIVGEADVA